MENYNCQIKIIYHQFDSDYFKLVFGSRLIKVSHKFVNQMIIVQIILHLTNIIVGKHENIFQVVKIILVDKKYLQIQHIG